MLLTNVIIEFFFISNNYRIVAIDKYNKSKYSIDSQIRINFCYYTTIASNPICYMVEEIRNGNPALVNPNKLSLFKEKVQPY